MSDGLEEQLHNAGVWLSPAVLSSLVIVARGELYALEVVEEAMRVLDVAAREVRGRLEGTRPPAPQKPPAAQPKPPRPVALLGPPPAIVPTNLILGVELPDLPPPPPPEPIAEPLAPRAPVDLEDGFEVLVEIAHLARGASAMSSPYRTLEAIAELAEGAVDGED